MIGSGRSHDASVWKRFPLNQHPELHFEDQAGYIIGDSAYPLDNWLIKPFARDNDLEKMEFNVLLSSARVNVEHAIGLLKIRFPLLQSIHMVTGSEENNEPVVLTIEALCVLHNFCLDQQDNLDLTAAEKASLRAWTEEAYNRAEQSDWMEAIQQQGAYNATPRRLQQLGELKRTYLMDVVREKPKLKKPFWWRN